MRTKKHFYLSFTTGMFIIIMKTTITEDIKGSASNKQNVACSERPMPWSAVGHLMAVVKSQTDIFFQEKNSGIPSEYLSYVYSNASDVALLDCTLHDSREDEFKRLLVDLSKQCTNFCLFVVLCPNNIIENIINTCRNYDLLRPWTLWVFQDPSALSMLDTFEFGGTGVLFAVPAVSDSQETTIANKDTPCLPYNAVKVYVRDVTYVQELATFLPSDDHPGLNLTNQDESVFAVPSTYQITDLQGQIIQVAAKLLPPLLKKGGEKEELSGICFDILKEFSSAMNLTFNLTIMSDVGTKPRNNKINEYWDGIIGALQRREYDLALGAFSITIERAEAIDFTDYFLEDTSSILSLKPKPRNNVMKFVQVFSWQTWTLLLISAIIVGPNLMALEKLQRNNKKIETTGSTQPYTLWQCWWELSIALLQKGELTPTGTAARVMAVVWLLFVVVLIGIYTGVLLAVMTLPGTEEPIEKLSQVTRSGTPFPLAFRPSATASYIQKAETPEASEIFKRWESNKEIVFPVLPQQAPKKLATGDHVLLSERLIIQYIISSQLTECKCCPFYEAKNSFLKHYYAFMVPKNSALKTSFNIILRRLSESGIIQHWLKESLPNITPCRERKSAQAEKRPMNLTDMQGVFYMLAVGLSFSLFGLAYEFIVVRRSRSRINAALQKTDTVLYSRRFKPRHQPTIMYF